MSNNNTDVNNVTTGKPRVTGAVFRAPAGTTPPDSAKTELSAEFQSMGYISEDGMTNSASRTTEDVKAWGGDVVLSPQTEKTDQFSLKFIEVLRTSVLEAVRGETNVSGSLDDELVVRENSKELEAGVWVIDTILTGGVLERTVIPNGKVTEVGDVVWKDNEAMGYDSTIKAFPYAEWDNDTHREFYTRGGQDVIGELTVTSVEGTETGATKITVAQTKAESNVYKYKVADEATEVTYGMNVRNWSTWDGESDITAESGKVITVVEATSEYTAHKAGSATVVSKE